MDRRQALRAVGALAKERPDWLPVLRAALVVAERCEPYGGEFAGAWVLDELKQQTGHSTWLPNLRVLISYGLLEKSGESVRGGRRAYYRCIDRDSISRAVAQLDQVEGPAERRQDARPSRFRFVGAGGSGKPGSEIARRAGDIPYEPRSWR